MLDPDIVDFALSTTRSVRRRIDFERPVPAEVIEACIAVAIQAPTGLDRQSWRFLIVTDTALKREIGNLYRETFDEFAGVRLSQMRARGEELPELRPAQRFLADHVHAFPALILVCSEGRPEPGDLALQVAFYGSVLPAAWSLMVALRARGIGATWTTLLAQRAPEVARVLGIPDDVTQTVLLPIGYTKGAVLMPAERKPPHEVTFWNRWGNAARANVDQRC